MNDTQQLIKQTIESEISHKFGKRVIVEYVVDIPLRVRKIEQLCGEKFNSVYAVNNVAGTFLPAVNGNPYYILISKNSKNMLDVMTAFHEYRHLIDYIMMFETVFNNDINKMKNSPVYVTFNVFSEYNATLFGVQQYIKIVKFDDLDKCDLAKVLLNKAKESYWNLENINNRYELLVCSMQYLGNIVACSQYDKDIDVRNLINEMELSNELCPVFKHVLEFENTKEWYVKLDGIMRKFVDVKVSN